MPADLLGGGVGRGQLERAAWMRAVGTDRVVTIKKTGRQRRLSGWTSRNSLIKGVERRQMLASGNDRIE